MATRRARTTDDDTAQRDRDAAYLDMVGRMICTSTWDQADLDRLDMADDVSPDAKVDALRMRLESGNDALSDALNDARRARWARSNTDRQGGA